jgi:hypothetical protein
MLTNLNTLKLLCFITDLGYVYSRFQKQIQSDDILIFDIEERRNILVKIIENLSLSTFPGGWQGRPQGGGQVGASPPLGFFMGQLS